MKKIVILLLFVLVVVIAVFVQYKGDKENAITYYKQGFEKFTHGDFEGAITDLNKAIELNPKFAEAYYLRGGMKNLLDDYKGAIADWEKAIELNPFLKDKLQPLIDEARRMKR